MLSALNSITPAHHDSADAALIPPAELAAHYDGRFQSFESQCAEHVERISEQLRTLRAHHAETREVGALRQQVGQLQRRLTEVQVQSAKERVRALRLEAEQKDLHVLRREHRDEIQRLLVAKRAQGPPVPPAPPGARPSTPALVQSPPSRCLFRQVEAPGGAATEAAEAENPADVWASLQDEVGVLGQELETFDASRAQRLERHLQEAAALEAELAGDLEGLENERERLANALIGYVQLRSQHLGLQRRHVEEIEILKMCNEELECRAEDLVSRHEQHVGELDEMAHRHAVEHIEHRRLAELLERHQTGVARLDLRDAVELGEKRVAELVAEVKALKDRCAAHRRRRKCTLDGLRVDLSTLARKLDVLDGVAEEVDRGIWHLCVGVTAANQVPARQAAGSARPKSVSPYGRRPPRAGADTRRCSAVRGVRQVALRRVKTGDCRSGSAL